MDLSQRRGADRAWPDHDRGFLTWGRAPRIPPGWSSARWSLRPARQVLRTDRFRDGVEAIDLRWPAPFDVLCPRRMLCVRGRGLMARLCRRRDHAPGDRGLDESGDVAGGHGARRGVQGLGGAEVREEVELAV